MVGLGTGRTAGLVRAAPWAGVLAVTTLFQVVRRQPVDVIVFATALVLVLLDAVLPGGLRPLHLHRALRSRPRIAVLVAAAVVVGGVLVLVPRHGTASVVVLAVLGVAVTALALVGDGAGGRQEWDAPAEPTARVRTRRAAVLWAGVIVVAGVVEASSFVLGDIGITDGSTMPSISDLLDPWLDDPGWHALYVVAWLAAGVGLLRRGSWEGEPCGS
ncbi:hypothetical protein [Ornithinimicrobium avium]|uniref:Uncharacterized protein n=1 Tax=Ornithinimicrobium avium TaxID=2283195 RepID=A0A345NR94_9MICO|nr:hypothetical protein [Ornithinimicrobium avium]AXH97552.1 hypothetical protein DV701_16820 [Ornithinimicrobium avium]